MKKRLKENLKQIRVKQGHFQVDDNHDGRVYLRYCFPGGGIQPQWLEPGEAEELGKALLATAKQIRDRREQADLF